MHESENARVEHRARRFDLRTRVVADIHAFADQRVAELGQMDANLMLPPGFEAALDQGRTRERSDRPDVRDRTLRLGRNSSPGSPEVAVGAAESVAAIHDQVGFDALRGDRAETHLVMDRRSEEHTSELQSRSDLVCRLLLEKKKK